jgi:flavodoxin
MIRRNFLKAGLAGIGTLAFPGTIKALTASSTSTGKTCVIYSSQCGSTKDAAAWINEGMGGIASVIDITTNPKVADYDYIVIGGWISSGGLVSNIKNYITTNKAALKENIRGLFTVCGNNGKAVGQEEVKTNLTQQIVAFTGVTSKPAKLFNGRSDPKCNNLGISYDLLKKEDCIAFGKLIIDSSTGIVSNCTEKSNQFNLSHATNQLTSVATISYMLPHGCNVLLTAYGLNGRKIATLVSSHQEAGAYSVNWNLSSLVPGIYLYRLNAAGFEETRIAKVTH